jgi:hypothetical protein
MKRLGSTVVRGRSRPPRHHPLPSGGGETQDRDELGFVGRKHTNARTPLRDSGRGSDCYPGSDLLSHTVTSAVPSALEGLTSVFGMGTGVAPPALPPGLVFEYKRCPDVASR